VASFLITVEENDMARLRSLGYGIGMTLSQAATHAILEHLNEVEYSSGWTTPAYEMPDDGSHVLVVITSPDSDPLMYIGFVVDDKWYDESGGPIPPGFTVSYWRELPDWPEELTNA